MIKKFMAGIKVDAKKTLLKAIFYSIRVAGDVFADGLYFAFIIPLLLLPSRTLARIKHTLSPTVRLDYAKDNIKLQADSLIDLNRARACEKEPETVRWIEECIQAGDVVYDVGANVGAYSLITSKFFRGMVKVYAFEPSFSTYNQLCRNIILNHCEDSVHPFLLALTASTGMVEFDYRSLEAGDAEHALSVQLTGMIPAYRQQLLAYSLDDLVVEFGFPHPTHIKLDVDGSELAILRGAAKILQSDSLKSILVEVRKDEGQADQVEYILRSAGFVLASIYDRGDGRIWNYIFRKKGKTNDSKADH
jgi:FkbM family methyltransferase